MSKNKGSSKDSSKIINNNVQASKKAKKKAVSEDGGSVTKQKPEISESKLSKRIGIITLIGLVILLFYSPYFRGLYFNQEMSTTFLYSGILFTLFLIYKLLNSDFKILKSPLDVAAGALVLAYFLPILLGTAASAQYSWDKFLRYANYFLIYLVARDLIGKYKNIKVLLNAVIVSAIGVSILGIDAGAGMILTNKINWVLENLPKWLHLQGGSAQLMNFKFFGGYTDGRIYSTLQYPNVFASYLGAVFLLAAGLLIVSNAMWKRFVYGAAGFILLYILLLTGSRGMFLVFPVMFLMLLIFLRKKPLVIDAVSSLGVAAGVTLLISYFFNYNELVNTANYSMVWVSLLVGAVACGTALVLVYKIRNILYEINNMIYVLTTVVITALVFVGIGVGLTLEKPLLIKHSLNEPDSEKSVIRDITGIKPDTRYSLEFNIDSSSPDPAKMVYKVSIYSINPFAELEPLKEISGGPENTVKRIEFTTKPDIRNIRLHMFNYSSGTSAAFSNFRLKDLNTGTEKRIIAQYMYLPTELVYKVKDISLKTHNAWQRLVFVGDAFKIIRDYPLGAGGGGWKALYHKYQSYGYASNEVHNHPVQLWVEAGIIGFVAFLVVIGLIIHHYYRTRMEIKELSEETIKKIVLPSVVFTAIISLYAHSVIDFDLSLSALSILVWVLTGFISGFYMQRERAHVAVKEGANMIALPTVVIMGLILVVSGFNSIYGRSVISEAGKYGAKLTEDQIKAVGPELAAIHQKYQTLQPLDEDRRVEYILLNNALSRLLPEEEGKAYFSEVKENIEVNLRNEPYSYRTLLQAASLYISGGDFDTGLGYADKAVEYAKFIGVVYKEKAELYLNAGNFAAAYGDKEKGRYYLERARNIRSEIDEVNRQAKTPMEISDEVNKGIDEVVNKAAQMLGTL